MTKKSVVAQLHQHEKYERLIAATKGMPALPTAVAHPCDETSLRGALEAADAGTIVPILVGPQEKIRNLAKSLGLDIKDVEIVDVPHSQAAAEKAVELVRTAKAELLMKGSLHSDELLGAVTKRDTGLRTGRRISHVFVMDVPTHPETLFITDAAVNIAPDLIAKRDIIQNAIDLYAGLGLGTPKVAILSAVETVNPDIPSTIEAAALCKMADRGQITGGELDGPLAFDNAISPEAARIKGIKSRVAGQAQILVVPDLRIRKHAGQEPVVSIPCRCSRDRARRACAHHTDFARRQCAHAPSFFCSCYAFRAQPKSKRASPELSHG